MSVFVGFLKNNAVILQSIFATEIITWICKKNKVKFRRTKLNQMKS